MGEGIFEATITQWLVNVGDTFEEDDSLVEIATDKVDSEVPAPINGIISKILVQNGEIAKIGQVIAIIEASENSNKNTESKEEKNQQKPELTTPLKLLQEPPIPNEIQHPSVPFRLENGIFLSPLVRSIAHKENVDINALNSISGSGLNGRIIKDDIVNYLNSKGLTSADHAISESTTSDTFEIIEMNRMRKLIAENMVRSKQTAPHVTTFHEVDVTSIVKWREKNKNIYMEKHNEKITFTPIFIQALAQAIEKYPLINVSVDGTSILKKNNINIGMATALPDGNLIVPIIRNANKLTTHQLATNVNDLAYRARNKKLLPNEIQGGTFTITNVGSFGNLSGTPIINQPEAAILAVGTIKKRPAVIETPDGDLIGIRHQMVLALSYDHRVIDGSLGGMFIKQVADNLEAFNGGKWLQ